MKGWLLAFALSLLLSSAPSRAAPVGSVRFVVGGVLTETRLRIEQGALRARVAGAARDAWTLQVAGTGAQLVAGSDAGITPCSTLFASVELRDGDGDGRIDPQRGEAARIYVAASLAGPEAWSLLLALEVGPGDEARIIWTHTSTTLPALGVLAAAPVIANSGPPGHGVLLIGSGWPRAAAQSPRHTPGALLQFDADTGAPGDPAFTGAASIAAGITALDLDADGRTDRLYFADAAFRIWRLDRNLAGGAGRAAQWAFDALLFADLSALDDGHATFAFTPDIALATDGTARWLDVSLGTANRPGLTASRHWLVRMRDSASPGAQAHLPALRLPVRVADLVSATKVNAGTAASGGVLLPLPGPLVTGLLTVGGHLLVATATRGVTAANCGVLVEWPVQVTLLEPLLATGAQSVAAAPSALVTTGPGAALSVAWTTEGSRALPTATCALGDVTLALCPAVPSQTREYWLRKDAP